MRLITWNCNMAFRKKAESILKYSPDILVIQESEKLEQEFLNNLMLQPNQYFWYGDNKNKGMSVFNFSSELSLTELEGTVENNRWIIPFNLTSKTYNFNFFAVWAMNHRGNQVIDKVRPIYRTFKGYSDYLTVPAVLIGDFNNNVIWDYQHKSHLGSFSDLLQLFREKDIYSCYHEYNQELFEQENQPTLLFRKNAVDPYHIDYFFCSKSILNNVNRVLIEKHEDWLHLSDHVPVIIDLKKANAKQNMESKVTNMIERYPLKDAGRTMCVFEKNGKYYGHILKDRTDKEPAKILFETQKFSSLEELKAEFTPREN
ncbi:endonuclease/exonuclease/phosphatase family protein [Paenibacillus aestuarii]|uniref:Endonuclease/exonuclease/phosphatase family protein n=1 Tax=Paenibacillus aestuarii TaxID=516965 RepID=A0ABW0K8D6_9BACL